MRLDWLSKRKGFSLVELLVIISIFIIFALVSLSRLVKVKYNLDLKGAVRTIASALLAAKTISLKEMDVAVDFSDSSQIKLCYDTNRDGKCSEDEIMIQVFPLDSSINLTVNNLVYFERGLPRNPVGGFGADTITVIHSKTNKCLSVIYSRTGRVRIDEC